MIPRYVKTFGYLRCFSLSKCVEPTTVKVFRWQEPKPYLHSGDYHRPAASQSRAAKKVSTRHTDTLAVGFCSETIRKHTLSKTVVQEFVWFYETGHKPPKTVNSHETVNNLTRLYAKITQHSP